MKDFNWKLLYGFISQKLIWIRIKKNYELAFGQTPLFFSERYGYKKHIPLLFGWRMILLKKGF